MELVLPVLLVILGAPVPGQPDRPVDAVRVTFSMEQCEALRRTLRSDGGAMRATQEMICVPLPSAEEFDRAYEETM